MLVCTEERSDRVHSEVPSGTDFDKLDALVDSPVEGTHP